MLATRITVLVPKQPKVSDRSGRRRSVKTVLRRNRHEVMQAKQFKHIAIDERRQDKDKKKKKRSTNEKIRKKPNRKKIHEKRRTNNSNNKIKSVTIRFDPEQLPVNDCVMELVECASQALPHKRYFRGFSLCLYFCCSRARVCSKRKLGRCILTWS